MLHLNFNLNLSLMKKLFLFFVLFVLAGASTLWAQTKVITGTVTSATEGEGTIPSVSVFVKGTTIATSTDANGRYSLNVPRKCNYPRFFLHRDETAGS